MKIGVFYFLPKRKKSAVHDRLWWSKRWSKRVFQTSAYWSILAQEMNKVAAIVGE